MVLCDIDHFKSINDTYGHPIGDLVLKRVAQILKSSSRETDVVARYGGEEFAILMDETDGQGALQIAERVRQNIMAEVFHSEQGPFQCTMSLGVATYPNDGKKKELVIVAADEALYHAKRAQAVTNRSEQAHLKVSLLFKDWLNCQILPHPKHLS